MSCSTSAVPRSPDGLRSRSGPATGLGQDAEQPGRRPARAQPQRRGRRRFRAGHGAGSRRPRDRCQRWLRPSGHGRLRARLGPVREPLGQSAHGRLSRQPRLRQAVLAGRGGAGRQDPAAACRTGLRRCPAVQPLRPIGQGRRRAGDAGGGCAAGGADGGSGRCRSGGGTGPAPAVLRPALSPDEPPVRLRNGTRHRPRSGPGLSLARTAWAADSPAGGSGLVRRRAPRRA